MFALEVEVLLRQLLPLGGVLERVPVQRVEVRAAGRGRDHSRVLVRGRLDPREERRHEQLREVVVADDVRPPLQVVAVLRQQVDWGPHHPTSPSQRRSARRSRFFGREEDSRIVEQDMKLLFLAQELVRGLLDGRQAAEVQLEEDSLLASRLLKGRDGVLRLLLASSRQVHPRVVL